MCVRRGDKRDGRRCRSRGNTDTGDDVRGVDAGELVEVIVVVVVVAVEVA